MDIVMLQTIAGESINGGRTTQAFVQDARYGVPDEIAQLWIGRGWANAAGQRTEARGKGGNDPAPHASRLTPHKEG